MPGHYHHKEKKPHVEFIIIDIPEAPMVNGFAGSTR